MIFQKIVYSIFNVEYMSDRIKISIVKNLIHLFDQLLYYIILILIIYVK